ncbi:MAG: acetyltransferase [Dehalococcoidales bacterium]|nr:acetyltransferase [Dehalococcoidales bacterium]
MNIVIIGAGGHGKVTLDILQYDTSVEVIGFIDDDENSRDKIISGVPVLGNMAALPRLIQEKRIEGGIIALGNRKVRAALFEHLKEMGLKPVNAVHPRAVIAKNVRMGDGVMIAAGAIINTDSIIGDDVIINTGATIDHDNMIGDHVNIQPGGNLGGAVTVKAYTEVGIGATVIQNISIGEGSTIAAGAAIISDVPDNVTVVGVPGRIFRADKREKGT